MEAPNQKPSTVQNVKFKDASAVARLLFHVCMLMMCFSVSWYRFRPSLSISIS